MGQRIVPAVILMAVLAFAVSALSSAFVFDRPAFWSASVALVILGGITPMIYAVNARIVPVFSGRDWQQPSLIYAAMLAGIAGGWLTYAGRALPNGNIETLGATAALAGGMLFVTSVVRLFRSPRIGRGGPPLPYPGQSTIDKLGTHFMRLAGFYLILGLAVGLALNFWSPLHGRWDLVWAHLLLLGWFLSMASGVLYHVLSRWTSEHWRWPRLIQAHLLITLVALPLMVIALGWNLSRLFAVAGPLQATAFLLMIVNIAPLIWKLPPQVRIGVVSATCFLALGVLLGASVAMDPANHATLRFAHAQINLYGWAGLLISGVGYYLFPRFAGQPLRWPGFARAQVFLLLTGVTMSSTSWWLYFRGNAWIKPYITTGALAIALSFLLFGAMMGLTFRRVERGVTVASIQPTARR